MIINDLIGKTKKERAREKKISKAKNITVGITVGTVLGTALGVLFAPKPGKETRKQIAEKTQDAMSAIKTTAADVKDKVLRIKEEEGSDECCPSKIESPKTAKE